jgi:hypothetical protein
MQIIDKSSAAQFLQGLAPDWMWLLARIEAEDGRLRFPPLVTRAIVNLKIESYPLLYENEAAIGLIVFRAFMSQDEIIELNSKITEQSPEERGQTLREMVDDLSEFDQAFELPKTPAEEKRDLARFEALTKDEQAEAIKIGQQLWMGFLAGFFQSLSVMVHGEKLTSLVAQAKAGNDEAFVKAVQIDKRILTSIPYFKQRFDRANLEGEQNFSDALAYRLQCPPYKGKIRHKALYLAFAFLDQVGLLDTMKHREILDLCNEAGLDAHANRIDDVKNLSKRLTEYRGFQARALDLSTP